MRAHAAATTGRARARPLDGLMAGREAGVRSRRWRRRAGRRGVDGSASALTVYFAVIPKRPKPESTRGRSVHEVVQGLKIAARGENAHALVHPPSLFPGAVSWPLVRAVAVRHLYGCTCARTEPTEEGTAVAEKTAAEVRASREGDPLPVPSAVPSPGALGALDCFDEAVHHSQAQREAARAELHDAATVELGVAARGRL